MLENAGRYPDNPDKMWYRSMSMDRRWIERAVDSAYVIIDHNNDGLITRREVEEAMDKNIQIAHPLLEDSI